MSMVKVLLKTFAATESSPQKILERINQTFLSDVKTDNFVTIFYAIIDTRTHEIRYTSAGHCPILILNRQTRACSQIKADGLFMGVFPDMMLAESILTYTPQNNRIILYTDGLVEAKTADDVMYGVNRLQDIALATIDAPPSQALEEILTFLYAECCTRNKAVKPENIIRLCK